MYIIPYYMGRCTFFVNGFLETGSENGDDPVVLTEDVDESGSQLSMMVFTHHSQDLDS